MAGDRCVGLGEERTVRDADGRGVRIASVSLCNCSTKTVTFYSALNIVSVMTYSRLTGLDVLTHGVKLTAFLDVTLCSLVFT
jgi:hypothetical protein